MKRLVFGIILNFCLQSLQAQIVGDISDSLALRFYHQLTIFPQEKIYVHTDKPYYVAGEKIWFRAYVADATTHEPAPVSRYVYVELIAPLHEVITRVKIRPQEGAYHGHLSIPRDAPQGYYTLRAYTTFMLNQKEDYFYTGTLYIGNDRAYAAYTDIHPAPYGDFDVSFYPEGGSLLSGAPGKVAFKAMKSNGQSAEVFGEVYNQSGTQVGTFMSNHLGMGVFSLFPQEGESYYAVCEYHDGQSKRFDLPPVLDCGHALAVAHVGDYLHVSVQKAAKNAPAGEFYLFAHTRGMVHLVEPWGYDKNRIIIPKKHLPSGVLHLTLFDARLNPVSERLVFVSNSDQAQVLYQSDNENYAKRTLVKNSVMITNNEGEPLAGSFSVAVTSDREVATDTTANILTHLLLASELRGHIEHPAFYFQNTTESDFALDLLMRTQGWRRYDVAEWAQGVFSQPVIPLELGSEISGTVKSALLGRPVEGVDVTVVSLKDSYFSATQTDMEGRFYLPTGELPDSTAFMVGAEPQRGMTNMDLIVDKEVFPKRTLSPVLPAPWDKARLAQYANKAEQQFMFEDGIGVTQLQAAVVTAERKPLKTSLYYSSPDNLLTEEELDKIHATNIANLLQGRFSGVYANTRGERLVGISIRGIPSLVLVDDAPVDIDYLNTINLNDIAQIDILKTVGKTAIFGIRGSGGVVSIHTKSGGSRSAIASQPFHIKTIVPLGYQQPAEFYAPKYETEAQRNVPGPDLRTTIHWQPVVHIDDLGVATFEFYTGDEATSYTVIIEGLANNGAIIRQTGKVVAM
ncbi:MAG: TonB-dependent receptor plug domain-containing protein [Bacteroidales bacterium]|nr:TonB-dependent receptor plug domain-containing protein [Bacteroidales bacterium]MCL2738610.1 TonB-dependent receptor plug domain-containing protein [Bacteroidales bacterium]